MKNRQKHTLGQIFAEELYRNAPKVSEEQAKKQAHIAQMQYRSSRCTKPRAVLLACILAVLLPTAGFAVKSLFFSQAVTVQRQTPAFTIRTDGIAQVGRVDANDGYISTTYAYQGIQFVLLEDYNDYAGNDATLRLEAVGTVFSQSVCGYTAQCYLDEDGFTAYLDAYKERCILYITIPSTDQAVCTYLLSQIIQ